MRQIAIKYLFNIFSGSTPESGQLLFWDGDFNWFTPDDLGKLGNQIYVTDSKRKVTEEGIENANLKFSKENSIIVSKRAPIGNLAILSQAASCNQGCFILEEKNDLVNSKYYYYFLSIQKDNLNSLGRGSTFLELNADDMKSFSVPYPDLVKQNKIVAYLDKEVTKLDALIEKKTRLVDLLEEKKKATISQAVTKGLNPKVKLKPSDIDWLGDIPEHWRLLQVKNTCTSINTGGTPNGYDVEIDENNKNIVDWFTPSDITTDFTYLKHAKKQLNLDIVNRSDIKFFSKNSVLFVGIGTIGKIGIPKEEYYTNQQINILEINKDNSNEYIGLLLSSNIEYVKSLANSATLPILNQQKLGEIKFYLPELPEQEQIVKYLQSIISDNHKIVSKINNSIELLKEKRTAIISAAINGEINL